MKIRLFLFALLLFSKSYSQELLNGKVSFVNNDNELIPLEGVSIYWQESSVGVISDVNGNYSIPFIKSTNLLVFKMLGFKEDVVTINKIINYDHILTNESNDLDEVIVSKRKNTIQKSYFCK